MRTAFTALAALVLAGCVSVPAEHPAPPTMVIPEVGKFSAAKPGEVLPSGWRLWTISGLKKPTQYRVVLDEGRTVVKASASGSASGLSYPLSVDLKRYPLLRWRWKVPALIPSADNTRRHAEDSPVRLIVAFEGDVSKLGFDDRLFASQFQLLTRREFPYATLMYIWENRVPKDSVLPNLHTSRIKMIVAESGRDSLGEWREETRNVYEDFKRAFGEEPPPVRSIAIMTDTDNTGESVDAYYGDIAFLRRAP